MKKPNRRLTSGELSQIMMKVCLLLGAICMIPIILSADTLELKFKIIDIVVLVAIIIGVAVDFVFKYVLAPKADEKNEADENEVANNEGETGK